MPSKSKSQQKFFGLVRAYQKGDVKGSEVSDEVKDAAKSMTKKEVKDFASTKHKGLPNHVKKNKKKKTSENKMRIFNITESQYNEIVSLLSEETVQGNGVKVPGGTVKTDFTPDTPTSPVQQIKQAKEASELTKVNGKDTPTETEVDMGGETVSLQVNNESVLISKKQVDEMRIHNRNKGSKLVKVKDFIR